MRREKTKYTEVKLDNTVMDGKYKNPLTQTYRYEYALYRAVTELFASVECRSMCIESLRLYFMEMPHSTEKSLEKNREEDPEDKKKKTQEGLLQEMAGMVASEVAGKIKFPMMHICRAEAHVVTEGDGTHTFIFSDGVYGFSVRLKMQGKWKPVGIETKNLSPETADVETKKLSPETAGVQETCVKKGVQEAGSIKQYASGLLDKEKKAGRPDRAESITRQDRTDRADSITRTDRAAGVA